MPNDGNKHFHFLDLPAELRNNIYRFALSAEMDLSLDEDKNGISIFNVTRSPILNLTPGLLSLSHQTTAEAAPILYGMRTFKFSDPCTLRTFLLQIGRTNVTLLRSIELQLFGGKRRVRGALHQLKAAKGLQRLEIMLPYVVDYQTRYLCLRKQDDVVEMLGPYLRAKKREFERIGEDKDVLRLLRLGYDRGSKKTESEEQYVERVRKMDGDLDGVIAALRNTLE